MASRVQRVHSLCRNIPLWIRFQSTSGHYRRALWRPAVFTIIVGSCSYCISVCWYESKRKSFLKKDVNTDHYPTLYRREESVIIMRIKQCKQWWQYQYYHDRFIYIVFSLNMCVFIAWRFKRLHPLLMRYFQSSPKQSNTSSVLLSSFSHVTWWHFIINMFVMSSFIPPFIDFVGREGSWPFYLTAGTATFASMVGHYSKVIRGLNIPSLGASGALLAIASLVILSNPDSNLYIIFLPFIPIPAYAGLASIITLDVIGLLRGWKLFDHAAHLGGVAFGMFYYHYGNSLYQYMRPRVTRIFNYLTGTINN